MAHPAAFVHAPALKWARDRAGLDLDAAASAAGVSPDKLGRWEAGNARPTFRQAQNLAQALHAPFGYLFLTQPPEQALPLPDLRTVGTAALARPSLNLLDTVRIALQRQAWFVDYLREQGATPLPFVGRDANSGKPSDVAAHMRRELAVRQASNQADGEAYFRSVVQAAEDKGILVMRSGIVGSNIHRKLDVGEFRGFAISDALAPVVFINAADAPAARLFTLIHELAHIWIGSSGVSSVAVGESQREEIFCNAVAGEFLVPERELRRLWPNSVEGPALIVARLASHFRVSALVVMRRAHDIGLVGRDTYLAHYHATLQTFRDDESSGGSYYRNAGAKNSVRFARAVLAEALSGRMLMREAGQLLGVHPAKIRAFAEQLGA